MNHGKFKKSAETLKKKTIRNFGKRFLMMMMKKNEWNSEANTSPQIVNKYRDYPLIDVYEWANQLLVGIECPVLNEQTSN